MKQINFGLIWILYSSPGFYDRFGALIDQIFTDNISFVQTFPIRT